MTAELGMDNTGNFDSGVSLELFPVDIGTYRNHPPLDTDAQVKALAVLLAPFGAQVTPWQTEEGLRGADAVQERLSSWTMPSSTTNTVLYWAGHGESDGIDAWLAHAYSPPELHISSFAPQQLLAYLNARQAHSSTDGTWAIVVIDACRSDRFIEALLGAGYMKGESPRDTLLVATSAGGTASLGRFTRALEAALDAFAADGSIDLRDLGNQLSRALPGCPVFPLTHTGRSLMRRTVPVAAGTVSTTLDVLAEIQAVIDVLSPDEQRHFLPKASGAELGEQAWYFEGREAERDAILRWLQNEPSGMLVVTGAAGSGKSALLGHVLLYTRPALREILLRHGHLDPLPPGMPCPDNAFHSILHASGAPLGELVARLARDTGHPVPPPQVPLGQQIDILLDALGTSRNADHPLCVLVDALDEAQLPLTVASQFLRRLAALPHVKLVVGTRRSTSDDPDQPHIDDTDLLDALGLTSHGVAPAPGASHLLMVERDPHAMVRYLRRRLTDAADRGDIPTDTAAIRAAAVQLGHQETAQFLYARLAAHEVTRDPTLLNNLWPLLSATHRDLFARAVARLGSHNPIFPALLHALALARGRGLPMRDGIWATIAEALTPQNRQVDDQIIHALIQSGAPYLMLDTENGQSVYRLAHRTFIEHFTAEQEATARHHALVTAALVSAANNQLPERDPAPYIVYHLASHAALGGERGWNALAQVLSVLDRLDVASITRQAMSRAVDAARLPSPVAGTLITQHLATKNPAERTFLRELGMAKTNGVFIAPPGATTFREAFGLLHFAHRRRTPLHLALTGHALSVRSVAAFTVADGRVLLATGGEDECVRIWDPITGDPVVEPLPGHTKGVYAVVAFTVADGRVLLATGGEDECVRIWDPITGDPVVEPLPGHTDWAHALATFTNPNGRVCLATGGEAGSVRIWDVLGSVPSGRALPGHTDWVSTVTAFNVDGRALLATGGFARVWTWDLHADSAGSQTSTNQDHWLRSIAVFSASEARSIRAAARHKAVCTWDYEDDQQGLALNEVLARKDGWVRSVAAFSAPDGRTLLAAASKGRVWTWDPLAGSTVGEPLTGHVGSVNAVAAFTAPDGRVLLATGGADRTVRIWDPLAGSTVGEPLTGHVGSVNAVAAFTAPDG
ncbi:AAA family ATPase, partial [Streptomyces adustus]